MPLSKETKIYEISLYQLKTMEYLQKKKKKRAFEVFSFTNP